MRSLSLVAALFISQAQADQVVSAEYGFIANPPVEMSFSSGTHELGKTISYQGFDESTELIYMINVNQHSEFAKVIEADPTLLRKMLGLNLEGYATTLKAEKGNLTQQWKTSLAKDAVHFTFDTEGFLPTEARSFHRGVKLFHRGAIYTLQVASIGKKSAKTEGAFDAFLKGFMLVDAVNEPATPKK